jgi:hypothetical protein
MMTIEERLKMYREKRQFIYDVSMAFIKNPKGHTVDGVVYEVFFRDTERGTEFAEWITVQYKGGAEAHHMAHGNSNSANFQQVAKMLDGGCYEYNSWYERLPNEGWKLLDLNKLAGLHEVK